MSEEIVDRGDIFDGQDEIEDYEDEDEIEDETEEVEVEEDEGEAEAEEESEDNLEEIVKKPKSISVPKSRLDSEIKQKNEFRDRTLWLEDQLSKLIEQNTKQEVEKIVPKVVYDFDTAEENYATLLIQGEIQQASKLRKEMEVARRAEMLELVSGISTQASNTAKSESTALLEADKFNTAIHTMESSYPFLDAESDSYNEDAVDTVNTLLKGYIANGLSKIEALTKAVNKVTPFYKVVEKKTTLGNVRTKEAGKKAADASRRQPVKTKSTSTKNIDLDTISVSKMSDNSFKKLTDKEKRVLRGD